MGIKYLIGFTVLTFIRYKCKIYAKTILAEIMHYTKKDKIFYSY